MTKRPDYPEINPSRVAVRTNNSTAEDPYSKRRLNVRFYTELENGQVLPEW